MTKIIVHRDAGLSVASIGEMAEVAAFGLLDSPLSPWYIGDIDYQGRHFSSLAQLVAWMRARFFRANTIANEILAERDPRALRGLSRQIQATDTAWLPQMELAMPSAVREMVSQNTDSLVALLATRARRLAFAVQNDLTWGVGLTADDPGILSPAAWPGKNLLGTILEQLREGYFGCLMDLFVAPADSRHLDRHAIEEVVKLVGACFALAEDLYDRAFVRSEVRLDLQGHTAGQARWIKGRKESVIRFNPVLLSENWQDFKDRTVPHEVAHVVTRDLYGEAVRSHGAEWQSVMRDFGCEVSRCHSYSVANSSANRGRRRVMRCACRIHLVSPRKDPNTGLRCRSCGKPVQYVISEAELIERVKAA